MLMICTSTYYSRVMKQEQPGTGLGVRWEGHLINQHFYDAGTLNTRFIPILLEGATEAAIPTPYRSATHYRPTTSDGYEALYRRLTEQPLTPKPALGTLRKMPPRERTQDFSSNPAEVQQAPTSAQTVKTKSTSINRTPDTATPRIWSLPFQRNPYFTGRDDLLTHLHNVLATVKQAALSQPQAISGLGGIVQDTNRH